jgi:hypothetical protein
MVRTIFVMVRTIFVIFKVRKRSYTKGSRGAENNVKHLKQKIVKQQQQGKDCCCKIKNPNKALF